MRTRRTGSRVGAAESVMIEGMDASTLINEIKIAENNELHKRVDI